VVIDRLKRDAVLVAVVAVFLGFALVNSRWVGLLFPAFTAMAAGLVLGWRSSSEHELAKHRVAAKALAGLAGFFLPMVAIALVSECLATSTATSTAVVALVVALVGLAAGLVEHARLRGPPAPRTGEPRGRVVFEGAAHAIDAPTRVPGTELEAVAWLARHEGRRWTSPGRFEVRDHERRVLVDPARIEFCERPWSMGGALGKRAKQELGVDISAHQALTTPLAMWSISEGTAICVVGTATLESGPEPPAFRDAKAVLVFGSGTRIGTWSLASARRAARTRIGLWLAIALGAAVVYAC
jgi:hypothetical protein